MVKKAFQVKKKLTVRSRCAGVGAISIVRAAYILTNYGIDSGLIGITLVRGKLHIRLCARARRWQSKILQPSTSTSIIVVARRSLYRYACIRLLLYNTSASMPTIGLDNHERSVGWSDSWRHWLYLGPTAPCLCRLSSKPSNTAHWSQEQSLSQSVYALECRKSILFGGLLE
jgi:hypothetical protein